MKKMLAIALSLSMLMSTTAMAAGDGANESSVTATYVNGNDSAPIVYSVDIEWEELDFTYYEESHATWDPDNLTYNNDYQAEGWAEGSVANVTMSNRSNTDILAYFGYSANAGFETVGMVFASAQVYMPSAEDGVEKSAGNSVSPNGKLPEGTDGDEIGTITITIEQCADITRDAARALQGTTETAMTSWNMGYNYNGCKGVESAAEVEIGAGYVLKSDVLEFNAGAYTTYKALMDTIQSGDLTSEQQSALNQGYYAYQAAWENFLATKCQIKE